MSIVNMLKTLFYLHKVTMVTVHPSNTVFRTTHVNTNGTSSKTLQYPVNCILYSHREIIVEVGCYAEYTHPVFLGREVSNGIGLTPVINPINDKVKEHSNYSLKEVSCGRV